MFHKYCTNVLVLQQISIHEESGLGFIFEVSCFITGDDELSLLIVYMKCIQCTFLCCTVNLFSVRFLVLLILFCLNRLLLL